MGNPLLAFAVIAATGYSIYSGERAYNDAQKAGSQSPPEPANSYTYDENGNVVNETVWNEKTNAYETRSNPEPIHPEDELRAKYKDAYADFEAALDKVPSHFNKDLMRAQFQAKIGEQIAEHQGTEEYKQAVADYETKHAAWLKAKGEREAVAAKKANLRNQLLSNLSAPPEHRVKMYDEYASNLSAKMHDEFDERHDKAVQSTEEGMTARGLYGSRAYVDSMTEMSKIKKDADVDISQRSALAREDLMNADRTFWSSLLGQIDSGMRADKALATQTAYGAADIARMGTQINMDAYKTELNNNMNLANLNMQRSNNYMNTASGLAFLYGFKGGAKNPLDSNKAPKPDENLTGNYDFANS